MILYMHNNIIYAGYIIHICYAYNVACARDGIKKKNVDLPTVYILRAAARAYIDRVIYTSQLILHIIYI